MAKSKVLIVDDEQSILNLVTSYLRSEEFDVRTAADGSTALQIARTFKPD